MSLNTIHGGVLLFDVNGLLDGSFHVRSSDFWPFFHGPPPILLKFGTLVGIDQKLTHGNFFLSRSSEFRDMGV